MQIHLKKQIIAACIVYIGQAISGFSMGWSAPVIPKLQDLDQTPLPDVITDQQASWVGSLSYIGIIIGPFIGGYISNLKGRRAVLFLGGILALVSFVMMAFVRQLYMLYTARIVMGFGGGILYVINLVYLGEIASTNVRGIFLVVTACFTTFGTFIIYLVGPYVSFAGTCWLGFGISAVFVAGCFFVPESPVFQVLNGEKGKAKENLLSLGRADEIEIVMEMGENVSTSLKKEWIEIFTIKSNRNALFITLVTNTLLQLSGIMAIIFFATTIFDLANSSIEPHIATIIIGLTQFLASSITPWFIERVGRRPLMLFSTAFTSLSLVVLATYFLLDRIEYESLDKIGWLPLLTLVCFFLGVELGFAIIPSTLTGEMFRANVRSTGSAITITFAWTVGFVITTTFGYMVASIGPDFTFYMHAAFSASAFIFTIIFVPETKGKTLLEIQEMLNK